MFLDTRSSVMSYTSLTYHIVFGTKKREYSLAETIRERLYAYIGGVVQHLDGHLLAIGGMGDHVHILASFHQTVDVATAIREIKANSARWINELDEYHHDFQWQSKYGAFTVSRSRIPELEEYIENQQEHHRHKTFREEFVQFLEKHDLEYDEEYVGH